MARLRKIKGVVAGAVTTNLSTPEMFAQPRVAKMRMTREVIPFDMARKPVKGWPTQLCAASLLWSSPVMGVVLKDKEGLFHAVETDRPRIPLGAVATLDIELHKSFEIVEFVNVPIIEFVGARQRALQSPDDCFVAANLDTYKGASTVTRRTIKNIKSAVDAWKIWHQQNVLRNKQNPPAPPNHISEPFVKIVEALLGVNSAHIAVMQKKDELVSDCISIDLFKSGGALGHGGSTREDMLAYMRSPKSSTLPVVLRIQADVFKSGIPILSVISTGIHEGAHYRQYAFTRQMIDQWHKKKSPGSGLSARQARVKFIGYVASQSRGKKKEISKSELIIIKSTLRSTTATHPLAQFHAFMGVYANYVRERDIAKKSRSLTLRPRFEQLLKGTDDWQKVSAQVIRELCVTALAEFAKRSGECVVTDLRELFEEFEGTHNRSAQALYKELKPLLQSDS